MATFLHHTRTNRTAACAAGSAFTTRGQDSAKRPAPIRPGPPPGEHPL